MDAAGLGGLIGEAPTLCDLSAETLEVWGMLGGYELQRMPVIDAISPIRDPEATVYCLGAIRDTLNERDA